MIGKASNLASAKEAFYTLYEELGTEVLFYKIKKETTSIYLENKNPEYESPVTFLAVARENLYDENLGSYVALEFPYVTVPIKSIEDANLSYDDVKHGMMYFLEKYYTITEVTRKNFMLGEYLDIRFELKPVSDGEVNL